MKHFIAALTLTAFSFSTFAATSATLQLKGNIAAKMSIEIDNPVVDDLNLVDGMDDEVIAVVTEKSNRKAGYKVNISSLNGGVLKNGTLDSIAYDLTYAGVLVGASLEVPYADQQALGNGTDRNVAITILPQVEEEKVSGNYTDTVTFTISAN